MFNWKLCVLYCVLALDLNAQKTQTILYKVSGRVTQTSSYCGGMAPTPEMMEAYNKPMKYSGKVLYVRKGKTNSLKQPIVFKIISDTGGNFSFKLPPGEYCIIQKEQVKKLNYKNFPNGKDIVLDKQCLLNWWKEPLAIITIKDNSVQNLNFNFHHQCFIPGDMPCLTYNGPLPP